MGKQESCMDAPFSHCRADVGRRSQDDSNPNYRSRSVQVPFFVVIWRRAVLRHLARWQPCHSETALSMITCRRRASFVGRQIDGRNLTSTWTNLSRTFFLELDSCSNLGPITCCKDHTELYHHERPRLQTLRHYPRVAQKICRNTRCRISSTLASRRSRLPQLLELRKVVRTSPTIPFPAL